jgi:hypothetical protein
MKRRLFGNQIVWAVQTVRAWLERRRKHRGREV